MADGMADAGVLVFDEDGDGGAAVSGWGGEEDTDAAAFVAAAAAAVLVVEFDSDGGDGAGEAFEGVGDMVSDEGTQGGGERDAPGQGLDDHFLSPIQKGRLTRNILGGLLVLVYDEVSAF
jgi:hypothetical protein